MWPWPIFRIFSFIKYQFFHNSFCQMRKVFMFLCIHSHLPRGHHHQTTQFSFHPMGQSSSHQFELLIAILIAPQIHLFSPNTVHFAFHPYSKQIRGNPSFPLLFILHTTCFALERINGHKGKNTASFQNHAEKQGKGKAKAKGQHKFPNCFSFHNKKRKKNLVVFDATDGENTTRDQPRARGTPQRSPMGKHCDGK